MRGAYSSRKGHHSVVRRRREGKPSSAAESCATPLLTTMVTTESRMPTGSDQKQREEDPGELGSSYFATPLLAPGLIFLSFGRTRQSHVCYNMQERRAYHHTNIPALPKSSCYGFSQGCLFMVSWDFRDCYLLNLWSPMMEEIPLPRLPTEARNCCLFILSSPPTDPNSVLLLVNWDSPFLYYCHISSRYGAPRKKRWITWRYTSPAEEAWVELFEDLVVLKGRVYGITNRGGLAEIDLEDPSVTFRKDGDVTPDQEYCTRLTEYKLVAADGELFVVLKCYANQQPNSAIETLEVFKMDFNAERWVKVHTLGNRAFFLCNNRGVSFPAGDEIRGDCIYYLENSEPTIYRFNMAWKSITVEPFRLEMKSKLHIDGLWIIPP